MSVKLTNAAAVLALSLAFAPLDRELRSPRSDPVGTLIIQVSGQPAKELPGGSYFSVPGKTRHTDACKPGPPCVVYFTGDAPLDRINVDTP